MGQGSRPDRVGEEIRHELATMLSRHVHDPGIGFVTLTRVKVSPDLQQARVFYTMLGTRSGRTRSARSSARRRSCAARSAPRCGCGAFQRSARVRRERREPDRIERILELKSEREERGAPSLRMPRQRRPGCEAGIERFAGFAGPARPADTEELPLMSASVVADAPESASRSSSLPTPDPMETRSLLLASRVARAGQERPTD